VCELGFEGVVAKNHSRVYRPSDCGWVKIKNPSYWRRERERKAMSRKGRHAQTV
jgi:ATP-dependent DNA ligase